MNIDKHLRLADQSGLVLEIQNLGLFGTKTYISGSWYTATCTYRCQVLDRLEFVPPRFEIFCVSLPKIWVSTVDMGNLVKIISSVNCFLFHVLIKQNFYFLRKFQMKPDGLCFCFLAKKWKSSSRWLSFGDKLLPFLWSQSYCKFLSASAYGIGFTDLCSFMRYFPTSQVLMSCSNCGKWSYFHCRC